MTRSDAPQSTHTRPVASHVGTILRGVSAAWCSQGAVPRTNGHNRLSVADPLKGPYHEGFMSNQLRVVVRKNIVYGTHNPLVVGSSPTGPTISSKDLQRSATMAFSRLDTRRRKTRLLAVRHNGLLSLSTSLLLPPQIGEQLRHLLIEFRVESLILCIPISHDNAESTAI
jgi:hypothetical protein